MPVFAGDWVRHAGRQLPHSRVSRDPDHQRTWVALVDGNNHQIDRINAQANARKIAATVHR